MLAPGEAFFAEPGDTVVWVRACSAGGTGGSDGTVVCVASFAGSARL